MKRGKMATWREVQNYLTSQYKLEDLGDGVLKLVFGYNDGRSQVIYCTPIAAESDDGFVVFLSPFATSSNLSPQQLVDLMSKNMFVGFGSNANGAYTVVHQAPLKNLDASEIEWALELISGTADLLEKELGLGDVF